MSDSAISHLTSHISQLGLVKSNPRSGVTYGFALFKQHFRLIRYHPEGFCYSRELDLLQGGIKDVESLVEIVCFLLDPEQALRCSGLPPLVNLEDKPWKWVGEPTFRGVDSGLFGNRSSSWSGTIEASGNDETEAEAETCCQVRVKTIFLSRKKSENELTILRHLQEAGVSNIPTPFEGDSHLATDADFVSFCKESHEIENAASLDPITTIVRCPDGKTLDEITDLNTICAVYLKLVDILQATHNAGFLHCNLDPRNVVVVEEASSPSSSPDCWLINWDASRAIFKEAQGTPSFQLDWLFLDSTQRNSEYRTLNSHEAQHLYAIVAESLQHQKQVEGAKAQLSEKTLSYCKELLHSVYDELAAATLCLIRSVSRKRKDHRLQHPR